MAQARATRSPVNEALGGAARVFTVARPGVNAGPNTAARERPRGTGLFRFSDLQALYRTLSRVATRKSPARHLDRTQHLFGLCCIWIGPLNPEIDAIKTARLAKREPRSRGFPRSVLGPAFTPGCHPRPNPPF